MEQQEGRDPMRLWDLDELRELWACCQKNPERAIKQYGLPLVAVRHVYGLGNWAINQAIARQLFRGGHGGSQAISRYARNSRMIENKLPKKLRAIINGPGV